MKVSPVFDSCARVLLVDIKKKQEIGREEIYLDALSLTERLTILHKSGVTGVVCGGISNVMESMIIGAKIELISNISGNIEDVLKAYLAKELDRAQFHVPGFREDSPSKGAKERELDHENL